VGTLGVILKTMTMKYLGIIILLFLGCQNKKTNDIHETVLNENTVDASTDSLIVQRDKVFLDSLYTCNCDQFISKLEEIPNKDTNAYRITIKSTAGTWKKSKLINTRPEMSRISYCNEFYTVVSFACGGPCHSELFVFTKEDRPDEQYGYTQIVKNNPNIISYVINEEFEKLIFHNFLNNKEMTVNNPESGLYNYGQMDSIIMKKENVILYYSTESEKHETKTINIRPIL
jgi:hypothetical protein